MGFDLYDANGWVDRLGSAHCVVAMGEWAEANREKMPNIAEFFENGTVLISQELVDEAENALLPDDPGLAQAFSGMLENIVTCDLVAIISNGIVSSDDELN